MRLQQRIRLLLRLIEPHPSLDTALDSPIAGAYTQLLAHPSYTGAFWKRTLSRRTPASQRERWIANLSLDGGTRGGKQGLKYVSDSLYARSTPAAVHLTHPRHRPFARYSHRCRRGESGRRAPKHTSSKHDRRRPHAARSSSLPHKLLLKSIHPAIRACRPTLTDDATRAAPSRRTSCVRCWARARDSGADPLGGRAVRLSGGNTWQAGQLQQAGWRAGSGGAGVRGWFMRARCGTSATHGGTYRYGETLAPNVSRVHRPCPPLPQKASAPKVHEKKVAIFSPRAISKVTQRRSTWVTARAKSAWRNRRRRAHRCTCSSRSAMHTRYKKNAAHLPQRSYEGPDG